MLTRLHHAGILVDDIEAAVRFYRDAVGLAELDTVVDWEHQMTTVYLEAGRSALALHRPWPKSAVLRADLEANGAGLHYLAFETDDLSLPQHNPGDPPVFLDPGEHFGLRVQLFGPGDLAPEPRPSPVTNIDHVVIQSNNSAAVAGNFAESLGLDIKRTMSRPGTGAHLEFARLVDLVLEFAGPGDPKEDEAVSAKAWGIVLAVTDLDERLAALRAAGYEATDPRPAIQPGARISMVKAGSAGVPFALIAYSGQRPPIE